MPLNFLVFAANKYDPDYAFSQVRPICTQTDKNLQKHLHNSKKSSTFAP